MKLKYRFQVKGHLRLDGSAPLQFQGREFLFELGSQQEVTHLSITVQIDKLGLPTMSCGSGPNEVPQLNLVTPGWKELRPLVRSLEGVLSLYGVASINVRDPELIWIPESPEEKQSMTVFTFSMGRQEITLSEQPILPFAFAGQAVTAVDSLASHEIPMYFYRRGRQDLVEGHFIDAFYDFFFIIESLYANGKFKKVAMQQAFRSNQTLQSAVATTLASSELKIVASSRSHLGAAHKATYHGRTPEEVTDHLVELRGFLHHHTAKWADIWHPDDHEKYQLDAHVAGMTCGHIIQDAVLPLVYSDAGAQRFRSAMGLAVTQIYGDMI